jgi:hypothetical protein
MSQVPLAEWFSSAASAPMAAAFTTTPQGQPSCVLGMSDGTVALLELPALSHCHSSSSSSGVGVVRWSVLRHPSAVVGLALHPHQPLVLATSRYVLTQNWHVCVCVGGGLCR